MQTDRYGQSVSTADPDAAAAYFDAIDAFLALDDDALDGFGRAVEKDPGLAVAHLGLGLSLAADGRDGEAREAFAAAVRLRRDHPDRLTAREARQIDLITAPPGYLAAYTEHLERHPGDMLVLGFAAGLLSGRRIAAGTGRDAVLILAARPGEAFPDDWALAGICSLELEEAWQFAAAEAAAQRSLRDRPDNRAACHGYVHVLHETGRITQAESFLDDWFHTRPARSPLQTHLRWHHALVALEADDTEAGLRRYHAALDPRVSGRRTTLVDSAAVLWRLHIDGHGDLPWAPVAELARAQLRGPRAALFDVHAALALAAVDRAALGTLRDAWRAETARPNRDVVLAVLDGVAAHGEGRYDEAARHIGGVLSAVSLVGGSRLQQDIVVDTLCDALARSGEPGRAADILEDRKLRRRSRRDERWIDALRRRAAAEGR
ncbi:tetratricopeptide repeat protein [Dactylosporangium sp. NPDC000555]|uniref:tetratricopeptide repeat protein n=1 Tax=Dactylosporangium sp. NPDC000555 TaxID=3154260 RepID=UPI0033310B48